MNNLARQRCPLCTSDGSRDDYATRFLSLDDADGNFEVMSCKQCKFLWLSPLPSKQFLEAFYSDSYFENMDRNYSYELQANQQLPYFRNNALKFKSYGLSGDVLDIGAASGEFLECLKEVGLGGVGLELSEYACEKARLKELEIYQGDLSHVAVKDKSYSGIHISHVLEHVQDPIDFMAEVYEKMDPGGILFVEVPYQFYSVTDLILGVFKKNPPFSHFSIHHLSFFSPTTLRWLLENQGFQILTLSTFREDKRSYKGRGLRNLMVQSLLYLADITLRKGDVISIWARKPNNA